MPKHDRRERSGVKSHGAGKNVRDEKAQRGGTDGAGKGRGRQGRGKGRGGRGRRRGQARGDRGGKQRPDRSDRAAAPADPLMDDEEISVWMASVDGGAAHEEVNAVEVPKVRLKLNKAACDRLIMAPFLLDPVIGHDIRARRDAARSQRLQEAAEHKRHAIQTALRTAMVAAKAIARMRSRAIAARAAVATAKASTAHPGAALAGGGTNRSGRKASRKERRQSTVDRLRNQQPLLESWWQGDLQGMYELEFTPEPEPEPESKTSAMSDPTDSSAMRDPAAALAVGSAQETSDELAKTTSSLGARTSSKRDYTGVAFDTTDLVHQFLTLLVSAKHC